MDPSVCRLHPGVAVTGFCPACLRDRLAGLQPPSSADLRRCKSLSYARYAAASHQLEPQRRSCDLFRQEPPGSTAMEVVPDQQEEEERRMEMEPSRKSSSFGSLLGKKLQQWRLKKKEPTSFRGEQQLVGMDSSRRSCDQGSASAPRESAGPMFDRLAPAATMLSMEEEDSIPRSDGQIPVEEEDFYCDNTSGPVPGGCAQTRDYYLDSSSSGRRRRSSTTSGRNSFSDVSNELTTRMTANARVSPAIAAELYHAHHQSSVLVHHHQHHHQYRSRDWDQPGPGPTNDDFSGGLFRANKEANKPNKKKGIKGWSIWGLVHKKSSSSRKLPEEAGVHRSSFSPSSGAGVQVTEYPWPELRARGYNGQMLRCNSSISARRSISGTGMDVNGHGSGRRMRMDEVLLERTMSTRSTSYSTSGHDRHPMGAADYQINHHGAGVRSSSKSKPSKLSKGNIVLSGPGRQAGP